jgi:hypothetical protein
MEQMRQLKTTWFGDLFAPWLILVFDETAKFNASGYSD